MILYFFRRPPLPLSAYYRPVGLEYESKQSYRTIFYHNAFQVVCQLLPRKGICNRPDFYQYPSSAGQMSMKNLHMVEIWYSQLLFQRWMCQYVCWYWWYEFFQLENIFVILTEAKEKLISCFHHDKYQTKRVNSDYCRLLCLVRREDPRSW